MPNLNNFKSCIGRLYSSRVNAPKVKNPSIPFIALTTKQIA
jgi:hypothetical protein